MYDTEDQYFRSQIDAEVLAVEALSVVSRLSQLTSGICGCLLYRKPTEFRVTLKIYKTLQHSGCWKQQETPVLLPLTHVISAHRDSSKGTRLFLLK
jgi:hypothetical protein